MPIKGAPRGSYKGVLGTHLIGHQARSSHLGYDCYLTGSAQGGDVGQQGQGIPGKVRMVLRPNRLSPRITEATRTILPQEMWWPQRNHSGAHGCIDAVLTEDSKSMEMWKRTWPNHAFGFEDFLVWSQRRAANGIPAPRTGTLEGIATHLSSNVPRSHHTAPQFPVGTELADERVLIRKLDQDGYQVRIYVAKFRDRTSALRVDVLGTFAGEDDDGMLLGRAGGPAGASGRAGTGAGGRVLLGRAYVDLVDDRIWQVIEHHPGNCRALDLPAGLIYQVLGVKAPATAAQQAIRQDERPPERQLTPRQRAVEVGMKAAELNGPAAATLGDMGPLQAGPARMEELRTTNRRTRGGIMPPPVRDGMYGADLPAPEPLPVDDTVFPGGPPMQRS